MMVSPLIRIVAFGKCLNRESFASLKSTVAFSDLLISFFTSAVICFLKIMGMRNSNRMSVKRVMPVIFSIFLNFINWSDRSKFKAALSGHNK